MGVLPASLCLSLALAAAPASERKNGADKTEPADATALQVAEAAWRRGAYSEARRTLEPLAADLDAMSDAQDREKVLLLLADSALNDPTLDAEQRRSTAREQLSRQMDSDPAWKLAKDVYTPDLYDLYVELQVDRAGRASGECEARRISCSTDLAGAKADLETSREKYTDLSRKYGEQEVEVREQVARTRILAAIPFGFGHFYNAGVGSRKRRGGAPPSRGDRIDVALGATFLAAEAAVGITGLALLIRRTVVDGCRRTRGFQTGSLVCNLRGEDDPEVQAERRPGIIRRRKAEEVMAWTLLGLAVTDIIVAQVLFEEVETRSVKRVRRRDLDRSGKSEPVPARKPPKRRTKVRAAPAFSPTSVGVSVHVRF
ncbi:MAG TPA: hypothetical protein VFG69_07970 [Nannocystaceae bacterium]|nr:hypothetical protein [Nannocystaceae bacterium]